MNTTSDKIRVDARVNLPLDDGSVLPMSVPINAAPTAAEGLVAFPLILSPLEIDPSHWHITHAATGRTVGLIFQSESDAMNFAAELAPLTDWTETNPPRNLSHHVRQLSAAHGGITWDEYCQAGDR